jgi:putative restriction endonuclease
MSSSAEKYGTRWSREELILALYLYCQIPFAQTKANNSEIIRLAEVLGRTPASVARKLGNFGAFDPMLARRGISGLTHYSKADKSVWYEFYQRWTPLLQETRRLLAARNARPALLDEGDTMISEAPVFLPLGSTERRRQILTRLCQSFFRRAVLASYQSTCCVCGLEVEMCLVASHIIPWAVSKASRTDPENGLCLCALHDRAFDRGLITVDGSYRVLVSATLRNSSAKITEVILSAFQHRPIRMPTRFPPKPEFLAWHVDKVFRD